MSFLTNVRDEFYKNRLKRGCCRACEGYAALLFRPDPWQKQGYLKLPDESSAAYYRALLKNIFSENSETTVGSKGGSRLFLNVRALLTNYPFLKDYTIHTEFFNCESCIPAFIRGAFLACGKISDPQKEYHLELIIKHEQLSWELCRLLQQRGLDAKITERQNRFVVYLKESESIEDFLTMTGCVNATLQIMNAKAFKDLRNNLNRKTNFETANIQKASASCAKPLEAIAVLERSGILQTLPEDLQAAAKTRRDHIDLSLNELGALLGLSRSGVFHRLDKLVKLAKQQRLS